MKTYPRFLLLAVVGLFCLPSVDAQLSSQAEALRDRYLRRVAAADKMKNKAETSLNKAYQNEINLTQEELKRSFDALIQAAAVRNRTEEVRQLTLEREALLAPQGEGGLPAVMAATGPGTRYEELVGVWTTAPGSNYTYTFEFKSSKDVVYTYEYKSAAGESRNASNYRASQKGDRIVCTSSSGSNSRYEIELPFDPRDLKITYHYESSSGSSTRIYKLTRRP